MIAPLELPRRAGGFLLFVLLSCVGRSYQQRDPIKSFCRRWGHQAAVVDEKLYVDGGLITWNPMAQFPENYTNPYLIYHDLKTVANSGMPPPYANLSKNSSIPNVHGGVLWPDDVNKRIYLYGGEFYDHMPWPLALYAYDILHDQWDVINVLGSSQPRSLSYGAGLSISSRGEGYYYGGWMNNRTDSGWGSNPGQTSSYLLQYDMDTNTWTNQTGPDDIGRAEGAMVYIPAGDGGMMVYFGGIRSVEDGAWEAQPMEEVILFDVLSGKSYIQNATGKIPEHRRRFCAGATWTDDQSSYNIYLYGGAGEEEGSLGFDDIYVLSLPSFTWVRMYPTNSNGTGDFPHHSLSCNVVNNAQMLIHGGYFPATEDCDSEDQWGLHNLDMGKQNKDNSPWALYEPSKTQYVVPDDILSVIGGEPSGGATKRAPEDGFMHRDLGVLLTRTASLTERTATRSIQGPTQSSTPPADSDERGLAPGAIAGIAVGAAAGLIALTMVCFFLARCYRRGMLPLRQPVSQDHLHHGAPHPFSWHPHSPSYSVALPSQPISRPQTVQPYGGPPVELPSEGSHEPERQYHPYSTYSETGPAMEPKYDAQGNLWLPQVSIMQGPGSARSPSGNSFEIPSPTTPGKPRSEYAYGPARSQRDIEFEMIRRLSEDQRAPVPQPAYHYHQQYRY
ncbi:Kelch repeat-containing protein [Paramyrothecium foliicola]|nr:Kelch repeat-containing protein [Paramyrothecium foliicola]